MDDTPIPERIDTERLTMPSLRVLARLGFRRDHSTFDARGEVVWHVVDAGDLRPTGEAARPTG